MRVGYRQPYNSHSSGEDIAVALKYAHSIGIKEAILIGHSMGSAVISTASALALHDIHDSHPHAQPCYPNIVGLVLLAAQSAHCSDLELPFYRTIPILAIHGEQDRVLSPQCTHVILSRCPSQSKQIKIFRDSDHCFVNGWKQVYTEVVNWISGVWSGGERR